MKIFSRINKQIFRFGIVGFTSNIVLYLLYLLTTQIGVDPKIAMTLLFFIGALQTFLVNKNWTFSNQNSSKFSFIKYALIYSFAYLMNFLALVGFVDNLNIPHQIVQAAMVPTIAIMLFSLQKYWVFRRPEIN